MRRIVVAGGAAILAHGDVEDPMKPVFNAPVGTHGLGQFFRVECPRSDVVALFQLGSLGPHLAHRVDAADHLALRPGSRIDHACSGQDRSDLADQTAMGFLDPFVAGRFCSPVQEGVLDCLQQARLIALDRQQVVATLGDDLVGDELLATHSVDTDEKALEVEGRQEFGNGHDLVALAGHFLLAEDQPQVGGEGAYHVQRILPTIPRAAGRLAIDGEGATQGGYHPADPAAKRGFELLGIEEPENAQESVLGRHPVLQHQEAAQPSFTHPRPMRDVFDRVRIGEGRGNSHHQDLPEVMQRPIAGSARVVDFAQAVHQADPLRRTHIVRRKDESRRDSPRVHKMAVQGAERKRLSSWLNDNGNYSIRVRKPWHGGDYVGFLGDTQYQWAECAEMLWSESIGRLTRFPSRVVHIVDEIPQTGGLVLMATHTSLDAGTKPDQHYLERVINSRKSIVREGGHFVFMNHPDLHEAQVSTALNLQGLPKPWAATFEEVAQWTNVSKYESAIEVGSGGIHAFFSQPVPVDFHIEIETSAGRHSLPVAAGTIRIKLM